MAESTIRVQSNEGDFAIAITTHTGTDGVMGEYASVLAYENNVYGGSTHIAMGFIDRAAIIVLRDALIEAFPLAPRGWDIAETDTPQTVEGWDANALAAAREAGLLDDAPPAEAPTDPDEFERGYAAAVADFRHGLWHEEVAPIWKRGFNEAAYLSTQSGASLDADIAYGQSLEERKASRITDIEERLMNDGVLAWDGSTF